MSRLSPQQGDEAVSSRSDTARVEAFSDGVLAIVITLLVLEIKVPELANGQQAMLAVALLHLLPKIFAWVVSFLFVLVFWVAHHYFFAAIEQVDRGLLWLNGLFLLAISFTPFPTALAGEYPDQPIAIALLAFGFFLSASAFAAMRWYATYKCGLLLLPADIARAAMRRSLTAPLLYTVAMAMAAFWVPAALLIISLVPFIFVLAPAQPK